MLLVPLIGRLCTTEYSNQSGRRNVLETLSVVNPAVKLPRPSIQLIGDARRS